MEEKQKRITKIEMKKDNLIEQKEQLEFFLTEVKRAGDNCFFDSNTRDSVNIFIDNLVRESEIMDSELGVLESDIKFIERQN